MFVKGPFGGLPEMDDEAENLLRGNLAYDLGGIGSDEGHYDLPGQLFEAEAGGEGRSRYPYGLPTGCDRGG